MAPGNFVGLLADLHEARAITISSTGSSSSSGHPVHRNGVYKKRKVEVLSDPKPGTSFTLAQLKQWEIARKAAEKKEKKEMPRRPKVAVKNTVKPWTERKGPMVVEYMRAPQRPPTTVEKWLLHGFEEEWRQEQEDAWAEDPPPSQAWGSIEEWSRGVCDALELWVEV